MLRQKRQPLDLGFFDKAETAENRGSDLMLAPAWGSTRLVALVPQSPHNCATLFLIPRKWGKKRQKYGAHLIDLPMLEGATIEKKGDTAMQILKGPERKQIVKAYRDGFITLHELREQMECHEHRKIYKGTKAPVMERADDPTTTT